MHSFHLPLDVWVRYPCKSPLCLLHGTALLLVLWRGPLAVQLPLYSDFSSIMKRPMNGSRIPTSTSSTVTTVKTSVSPFNSKSWSLRKTLPLGAARRLEFLVSDFLIITQIEHGRFIHDGPETYSGTLQAYSRCEGGRGESNCTKSLVSKLDQ